MNGGAASSPGVVALKSEVGSLKTAHSQFFIKSPVLSRILRARRPTGRHRCRIPGMRVQFPPGPLRFGSKCGERARRVEPHFGRAAEWDLPRAVTPVSLGLGGSIPHTPAMPRGATGSMSRLERDDLRSNRSEATSLFAAVAGKRGAALPGWMTRMRVPPAACTRSSAARTGGR